VQGGGGLKGTEREDRIGWWGSRMRSKEKCWSGVVKGVEGVVREGGRNDGKWGEGWRGG